MRHTEEKIRAAITEPPDGTKLVVVGTHQWKVIWRDDNAAKLSWGGDDPDGQHWFDDHDEDPMALYEHLKCADAVYQLGEPLAVFA